MSDCRRFHPVLSRLAEGEAGPGETLHVAGHLRACTACRILLARERRLAGALERQLVDEIDPGREFLRAVMERLPDGPPPRRDRRGLKIAMGIAVALLGGAGLARVVAAIGPGSSSARLTGLELPAGDSLPEAVGRLGELVLVLLGAVGARLAPALGWLPELPALALGLALPAALAMLTASLLTAVAARQLLRIRPPAR